MTAITIFVTFLLLVVILFAGAWGAYWAYRRITFLEGEYRALRLASVEDLQQSERKWKVLEDRLDSIEARSSDSAQRAGQSVNYTQRSQMLRMIRRGDSAEQIASTLGVSPSQVRLLMKLPGVAAREKAAGQAT